MRTCLAAAFALAACGSAPLPSAAPPPPPPPADHVLSNQAPAPAAGDHVLLASLARTACFGWCPIYTVTVYRDGVVEYDGEHYVKTTGKATGHLAPAELAKLDDLFTSKGYLALGSDYTREDATDNPSANTAYRPAGGATKSVNHYYGDDHAPEVLRDIENGVDQIVHVEQWIGTEKERDKLFGGG